MKNTSYLRKAAAIGTAAAIAVSASTAAFAAPIGAGQVAIKNAAATDVMEVGWKGRRNTAFALGALGALAFGSALAHGYYHPYPYAYPYAYAPAPTRKCLVYDPYRHRNTWVYC